MAAELGLFVVYAASHVWNASRTKATQHMHFYAQASLIELNSIVLKLVCLSSGFDWLLRRPNSKLEFVKSSFE